LFCLLFPDDIGHGLYKVMSDKPPDEFRVVTDVDETSSNVNCSGSDVMDDVVINSAVGVMENNILANIPDVDQVVLDVLDDGVGNSSGVISGDDHFIDGMVTSFSDIPGDTICMDFTEGMPTTLSASTDPFLDPISLDTDKVASELLANIFPDGNFKVDDDPVMSMEPLSMPALRGTVSGKLLYYVLL
jgi:hypothetical protein